MAEGLISVSEAQARLLAMARPVESEICPLDKAVGRWLTQDLKALRNQPWTDLSAMDGYAIRFCDLPGSWTVVGESAAGAAMPRALKKGEAMRIFTGAPMPPGSDSVLVQEDAARDGLVLNLAGSGPDNAGRHVRRKAMDFGIGQNVLSAGTRLGAAQLALAALAGHGAAHVGRSVQVALFSTGNELVPVGVPVADGQLPCSNAIMLAAMLDGLPVEIIDLGIVGDDLDQTISAFRQAATADVIITTGGASVGDHDLIRPAFSAAGGNLDFWRIAMQPGKPLMAGRLRNGIFLGLPGNPVSAFATAKLFLLPLIRHMSGSLSPLPQFIPATLGAAMAATGARAQYVRATLSDGIATPLAEQDSGAVFALSRAEALILRSVHSPVAKVGDQIQVLPL